MRQVNSHLVPVHQVPQALVELVERLFGRCGRGRTVRVRQRCSRVRPCMMCDGRSECSSICAGDPAEQRMALITPITSTFITNICNSGKRTRSRIKLGTASTSKDSVISPCSSASIINTSKLGYFLPSSLTTSFICAHGAAHGAQKFSSDTRERSALRSSLKWSGECTS